MCLSLMWTVVADRPVHFRNKNVKIMVHSRNIAALAAVALSAGALGPVAPAMAEEDIGTIVGGSETPYGAARGWTVFSGTGKDGSAYCVAETGQGQDRLRIGFSNEHWQLAVPFASKPDYTGFLTVDGGKRMISGFATGQWTIAWMDLPDLDRVKNGASMVFDMGTRSVTHGLTGAAAAVLKVQECIARSGGATAAEGGGGEATASLHAAWTKKLGRWELTRYTRDEEGADLSHCTAMVLTGSEQGLRFSYSAPAGSFVYGFSGLGSAADAAAIPLRVWFDGNKAGALEATAELAADENGFEWRSVHQGAADAGGLEARFAGAKKVTFAYKVDGKAHSESFALPDVGAVLKQLLACGA